MKIKATKCLFIIIVMCLAGCIEVEDNRNTNRIDEFECYRKANELGVKAKWYGLFDECDLYIDGDTITYRYKR